MIITMKYNVTLGSKTYEVEVEKGEATLLNVSNAAPTAVPVATAAPAPAPVAAAPQPAPVATAPASAAAATSGEVMPSPLPGTILSVKVAAGQSVKKGDVLLVIEAMKMENEILAHRDAVVSQILVKQGDSVDTGASLLTLA
jgi:glutaconyl-CoA decarboxylase